MGIMSLASYGCLMASKYGTEPIERRYKAFEEFLAHKLIIGP